MFSQLGPLFKTTFRQAESNDTRQGIPHDERDKGRRKREEAEKKEIHQELWEDDTSVSVIALKTFLINFLKTLPGTEDTAFIESREDKAPLPTRPPERTRPTSTRNARAVRAYQSMARHQANTGTSYTPSATTQKSAAPTADLLESKELRDIHKLIDDLDIVAANGVDILHIFKADSFIESLQNAVRLAKSKI